MSAPPDPDELPDFHAFPLPAEQLSEAKVQEDFTFYLHRKSPEPLQAKLPKRIRDHNQQDYRNIQEFLEKPASRRLTVADDGTIATDMRPRLSYAGVAQVLCLPNNTETDAYPCTARALACFAAKRESISITLRSLSCATQSPVPNVGDGTRLPMKIEPGWIKSKFQARQERDARFWFSVHDQCAVLAERIFAQATNGGVLPAQGLVVLTGGTNSCKSHIARGLIEWYLSERSRTTGQERRPHLVTYEDPIEVYYCEPARPKELKLPEHQDYRAILGDGTELDKKAKLSAYLLGIPKTQLAACLGIDYSPRERHTDVHDLAQAFADALRQTPAAFYVGEVRDPAEWRHVLEFAGTGHLVFATAHAGSLLEAMVKILSAVGASTAADRRRYAARLLAAVHLRADMRKLPHEPSSSPDIDSRTLLLPAMWRKTDCGLAELSANGYGAIVPRCPGAGKLKGCSTLGRRWFAARLIDHLRSVTKSLSDAWQLEDTESGRSAAKQLAADITRKGAKHDINGE
jgi:hypothetical protein